MQIEGPGSKIAMKMAKKWRKAMIIVTLVETIADSAPCAKSC